MLHERISDLNVQRKKIGAKRVWTSKEGGLGADFGEVHAGPGTCYGAPSLSNRTMAGRRISRLTVLSQFACVRAILCRV